MVGAPAGISNFSQRLNILGDVSVKLGKSQPKIPSYSKTRFPRLAECAAFTCPGRLTRLLTNGKSYVVRLGCTAKYSKAGWRHLSYIGRNSTQMLMELGGIVA